MSDLSKVPVTIVTGFLGAGKTTLISHLIREAGGDVLRIKGYAAVAGKPMRLLVQAVGARVRTHYDRAWAAGEPRGTRLVVIAERDRLHPVVVRTALQG